MRCMNMMTCSDAHLRQLVETIKQFILIEILFNCLLFLEILLKVKLEPSERMGYG